MTQTVQIYRSNTNVAPATLLPGVLSTELGPQTKLWVGSGSGNRLLFSSDPVDTNGAARAVVSPTAPVAAPGILWWDSTGGQLYVRYDDGNTVQWVPATNPPPPVIGTVPVNKGGTGTTTAMTPGSVMFAGPAGVYSQDNPNLFWDNSANSLGIGTATPQGVLNVITPGAVPIFPIAGRGLAANLYNGSASSPVTTTDPTVAISRHEALNDLVGTGGGNAGLVVSAWGHNTSGTNNAQTNGIYAYAAQTGGSSGDVCAGYFYCDQAGLASSSGLPAGSWHGSFGVFATAVAGTPATASPGGVSAVAVNPVVVNDTGRDQTWATFTGPINNNNATLGLGVQGGGANINTAGIAIAPAFDVGVGFLPGSVRTADIQSNSSAATSYKAAGTYGYGIDFNGSTISAADIRLHHGDAISNYSAGAIGVVCSSFGVGTTASRGPLEVYIGSSTGPTALNASVAGSVIVSDAANTGCQIGTWNISAGHYPTFIQARNHGAVSGTYDLLLQPLGGNVGVNTATTYSPLSVKGGSSAPTASANPNSIATFTSTTTIQLEIGSLSAGYGVWLQGKAETQSVGYPILLNPAGGGVVLGSIYQNIPRGPVELGVGASGPTPLSTATPSGSALIGDATTNIGAQMGIWDLGGGQYPFFIQSRHFSAATGPYNMVLQPLGGAVSINTYNAGWSLTVNGTTANNTGAWQTISARELKEQIAPYERSLAAVRMLNPCVFRYRAGTPFAKSEDEASEVHIGLLADEVEPVMPELVSEATVTIGKEEIAVASLMPGNVIYAVINSIKELAMRVEMLEGAS